jgi:DNA primase
MGADPAGSPPGGGARHGDAGQWRDLEDPKVKSEIAAQVLPLIEDVPNAVEREAYRQRLRALLRVDERAFVGTGCARGAPPAAP